MGISIWQLLIVLAIVLLLFGAKRLRSLGGDLGTAVKGFKQSMGDAAAPPEQVAPAEQVAEGEQPQANAWDKKSVT